MFQNILKLMVPLSKYNVLKIKVIFLYFKQEYVFTEPNAAKYLYKVNEKNVWGRLKLCDRVEIILIGLPIFF